jgi:hypothetical protein
MDFLSTKFKSNRDAISSRRDKAPNLLELARNHSVACANLDIAGQDRCQTKHFIERKSDSGIGQRKSAGM